MIAVLRAVEEAGSISGVRSLYSHITEQQVRDALYFPQLIMEPKRGMASNNLRLLIDESVTEPLASQILALVGTAVSSKQTVGAGVDDADVAAFANKHRRIIVAIDSDFESHSVKFGVIRIKTLRTSSSCQLRCSKPSGSLAFARRPKRERQFSWSRSQDQ